MNNGIAKTLKLVGNIVGGLGLFGGLILCGSEQNVYSPYTNGYTQSWTATSLAHGIILIVSSAVTMLILYGFAEIIEQLTLINLNTNSKKPNKTIAEQLKDLKTLLDDGMISKEEFENKKAQLLNS